MKAIFFTLLSCCLLSSCGPHFSPSFSSTSSHAGKYADKLEAGAVLVQSSINHTVEKTRESAYLLKIYRPDTRQLTQLFTYRDKALTTLDGPSKEWWDDGSPWVEGSYVANKREGEWKIYEGSIVNTGKYVGNKQEGLWIGTDSLGAKSSETNYLDGQPHGAFKHWDKTGKLIREGAFNNGKLEWSKNYASEPVEVPNSKQVEVQPQFPGCDEVADEAERKKCAEMKMLQFIYSTIKYPAFARTNGIEGTAYLVFVVEKDGSITDIVTKRGLCAEVQAECERVIRSMPKWHGGTQNGKPVRVKFTMPIKFKLE